MKDRVLVALILVPILFVILFLLPPFAFVIVMALICAICAYELLHSIGRNGNGSENDRITIYAIISSCLIPIGIHYQVGELVFITAFLALMCLVFLEAILFYKTKKEIKFSQILTAIFAGALMPLTLSSLVILRNLPEGQLMVLIPFVSAFVTDAGAYFTGVIIGKHRAFPRISPNKTVEGYIGGLITGTAVMLLYGAIIYFSTLHEVKFHALILYGIIGAIVTSLGDLSFSLVKREFNIKDYGKLIPGHGGMLDRFDSMVFTAPALYLLIFAIPAIIVK